MQVHILPKHPHIHTSTHYKIHTYTHSHITKQVNTYRMNNTIQNNHSTKYTPNKIVKIQSSTLNIRSP